MRSWGNEGARVCGRLREAGWLSGTDMYSYFRSLDCRRAGADGLVNDGVAVHFIVDKGGLLCYFLPVPFVYWVRIVSDTF